MNITYVNPGEPCAVFAIEGSLDTLEAKTFLDTILPVLETDIQSAVLDCTDMPYLTSTGLRAIMTVGKTLNARSGKLFVYGMQGLARQIYESSGFTQVFPLIASMDEAHAAMNS